jgi:hypothetical protein
MGLREGSGSMQFKDGSTLTGNWKADVANGTNMVWKAGGTSNHWIRSYSGPYERGVPHGKNGEAEFQGSGETRKFNRAVTNFVC